MKKILVVVDYQEDFVNGVLAVPEAEKIKNFIQDEINGDYEKVFYTFDTHTKEQYKGSDEEKLFPNIHCEFFTDGWNLRVTPKNQIFVNEPFEKIEKGKEVFFCKDKFDIFEGNSIYEEYIKQFKDYEFVLVGVATNYCVFTHAMGLIERGYKVSILNDGVKGILDDTYEDRVREMKIRGIQWKF